MESNQDPNTHCVRVENLTAAPFLHFFSLFPLFVEDIESSSVLTYLCYYNVFFWPLHALWVKSLKRFCCSSWAQRSSQVMVSVSIRRCVVHLAAFLEWCWPSWWAVSAATYSWAVWKRRRSHWHCLWERKTNYVSFLLTWFSQPAVCFV